eukprot:7068862-Prymnesium_polylepis.1
MRVAPKALPPLLSQTVDRRDGRPSVQALRKLLAGAEVMCEEPNDKVNDFQGQVHPRAPFGDLGAGGDRAGGMGAGGEAATHRGPTCRLPAAPCRSRAGSPRVSLHPSPPTRH